jgi:hypothetical protein
MDKLIIVSLDIKQMTQTMNFLEIEAKSIFDIGCDDLGPSVAIIFFIHALHLWRG